MPRTYLSPRQAARLKNEAKKALADAPGQSEAALARRLGTDKAVVVQVLMGSLDVFRPVGEPPKWRLHTPASRKQANARIEREAAAAANRKAHTVDGSGKQRIAKDRRTESWDAPLEPGKLPTMASFRLYPWQKEAFKSWVEADCRGIVNAVTGAGKTRLALAAIRYQLSKRGRVVIVVPNISLLNQWYEEVRAAFPGRNVARLGGPHKQTLRDGQILVAVVASGRRYSFDLPTGSCLLIADECHRYAGGENKKVLEEGFDRRLGLTATHERMDGLHLTVLAPYFGKVVYELGFKEATEAKVIAPLRIATLGCDFTKRERKAYDELTERLTSMHATLVGKYRLPKKDFAAFFAAVTKLSGGSGAGANLAKAWLSAWADRRAMLTEASQKQDLLRRIAPAIADADRCLVFTTSIASATEIAALIRGAGLSAAAHTSKTSVEEREKMLQAFASGKLKVLVSAMTLEEGVDVPEADLAVIVGTSQQRRQLIQRLGRVLRRKPDRRYARFVYLYVRETVEDPSSHRSELLLEDVLEVAEEVEDLRIPGELTMLRRFLGPRRRRATGRSLRLVAKT